MDQNDSISNAPKDKWETPVLLDLNVRDAQGAFPGTDEGDLGFTS